MPIITIQLDTNKQQDVEILRLIYPKLLGPEESKLNDYNDFWQRTSKRTREVLKIWSQACDQKPRMIMQLNKDLQIEIPRIHAVIANLGKWRKQTTLPLLESFNRHHKLSAGLWDFLQKADIDAPCFGSAMITNQLADNGCNWNGEKKIRRRG